MATFQTMNNAVLRLNITLFVGNTLRFKVVPAKGELVPFKLLASVPAPPIVSVVKDDVRNTANFQIYDVQAKTVGVVQLTADNGKGAKAGPLKITVKAPLVLPDAKTDAGALTRLLLAESLSPYFQQYDANEAKTGMQWMRLVVDNRLKRASSDVGTANAKSRADVIKSYVLIDGKKIVQFRGFENYPQIADAQLRAIQAILDVANDGAHPKQEVFYNHVLAAIEVPVGKAIVDPCATGLLGWRTKDATGSGGQFVLYKSYAGQDFYTIK
jgi:hypothetical protein